MINPINPVLEHLQIIMKEQYFRKMLDKTEQKNPITMDYSELQKFAIDNDLITSFNDEELKIRYLIEEYDYKIQKIMRYETDAIFILQKLFDNSENSYLVGGSIRDILLDKEPKDFDFVTDLSYDQLKTIFDGPQFQFKETGKQFLVFNLNYNGVDYEIANFRADGTYTDGRRPDSVSIGTIEEDLMRRDFTINNCYWNFNGLVIKRQSLFDIRDRVLRFVGNPEDRIIEDGLRIMRFYRLVKSKDLIPDKNSLRAVRTNFDKVLAVSSHRIMMELERICL